MKEYGELLSGHARAAFLEAEAERLKIKAGDAIRFLEHEAGQCRDRDTCEALCLLVPAVRHQLGLVPMDHFEAEAFRHQLRNLIKQRKEAA